MTSTPPNEWFFVLPDDGLDPLLDVLHSVRNTLDVYVFVLDNAPIEEALVAAQARGVRVRALVEPNPSGRSAEAQATLERLRAEGVSAQHANPSLSKTHAKALVADGRTAVVATLNFDSRWPTTRDYGVITGDSSLVNGLAAVFEADWHGGLPEPLDLAGPLVLSPSPGRSWFTSFILGATASLHLQQEQLTDPQVIALLGQVAERGVEVRVIVPEGDDGRAARAALGPPVKVAFQHGPRLHAKLIIVDERRLLVGSHNMTAESLDLRREVSLLTAQPDFIERALRTFEADAVFDEEPR